jgi:predicted metalloprotease with PDZ domain
MRVLTAIGILCGLVPCLCAAERPGPKVQVYVERGRGAHVTRVFDGWPAANARTAGGYKAALEEGDIIVAVDGTPVRQTADLGDALQQTRGSARLDVINCRDGKLVRLWVLPSMGRDGMKRIGVEVETALPAQSAPVQQAR